MMNRARKIGKRDAAVIILSCIWVLSVSMFLFYGNRIRSGGENGRHDPLSVMAVLHNDFRGTADKRVYVENTGEAPLYVRVKLTEYMELDGKSVNISSREHLSTWVAHECRRTAENCGQVFHEYFQWEMGGRGEFLPSAPNSDTTVNRYVFDPVTASYVDSWENAEGLIEIAACKVVTMESLREMESAARGEFTGWVVDTDGFAYWTQSVAVGETTGLLISKIELVKDPESDYYYAVNTVAEMVSADDLGVWIRGGVTRDGLSAARASENAAKYILKPLSPQYDPITDEMLAENPAAALYDTDEDGFLSLSEKEKMGAIFVQGKAE
ncbi:MAG: hypothetical protein FWF05_05990 [Oscillospiraceae bacterium]|nr:hypothetical protein [Oscillospiraceae bacterium]